MAVNPESAELSGRRQTSKYASFHYKSWMKAFSESKEPDTAEREAALSPTGVWKGEWSWLTAL